MKYFKYIDYTDFSINYLKSKFKMINLLYCTKLLYCKYCTVLSFIIFIEPEGVTHEIRIAIEVDRALSAQQAKVTI
jgi:hypothetical protein